ncbi:hypothetical protein PISMIDRAFT_6283 [Pisolithus microcarpus 441]|uniref:Uncharacterized protein n=1 Tax=Pisolithus microcarpus 441 TaxID=765257 RepID=A0A0D0A6U7_9AGAM|nr:hypothetical protein PISMIDRAFT_6283 [Pisolithus microcarpus 441]
MALQERPKTLYVLLRRTSPRNLPPLFEDAERISDHTVTAVLKILNSTFDVYRRYWADHAVSMCELLAPPTTLVARDIEKHDPLQMLPPTLLLWEGVPTTSPFYPSASLAIHFSMRCLSKEPWNDLADFLLFLVGLGSVREGKRMEKVAYVLGNRSATGILLCNGKAMNLSDTAASMFVEVERSMIIGQRWIRAGVVGDGASDGLLSDANLERCLATTRYVEAIPHNAAFTNTA